MLTKAQFRAIYAKNCSRPEERVATRIANARNERELKTVMDKYYEKLSNRQKKDVVFNLQSRLKNARRFAGYA